MATVKTETREVTFLQKLLVLQTAMADYTWEKDGLNRHQSYKYISEKQYKNNFKKALQQAGLIWKMEEVVEERTYIESISDKMHLVLTSFKGTLIDPVTDEREVYRFGGSGADNGDKAIYKAYTGGLKYFLASNFNVGEDSDPESDDQHNKDEKPKHTTPEKREAVKEGLINKDGIATKMQIEALKKQLISLREADPEQETFISDIAIRTESFTNITKKQCEQLIIKVGDMLEIAKGA